MLDTGIRKANAVANRLFFAFRAFSRWRRAGYRERSESKQGLFEGHETRQALEARETELLARYDLAGFRERSGRLRYLEALSHLDFLDRMMAGFSWPDPLPDFLEEDPHTASPTPKPSASTGVRAGAPVSWLDVGAKNWAYVDGLDAFLKTRVDGVYSLTGIELDPYRLYQDFHSRADYAEAYLRHLPRARYQAGDVRDLPAHRLEGTFDGISCFLPFVFEEPSLAWGLPDVYFDPPGVLQAMIRLLKPGGILIIVNQGAEEAREQARLFGELTALGDNEGVEFLETPVETPVETPTVLPIPSLKKALEIVSLGELPETFLSYRYPRYGFLCRKK